MTDARSAATLLRDAYATRQLVPTLSSLDPAFDLNAAYAVERELVRMRRAAGHRTIGRKVGFANKAMWRVLKLDTLASAVALAPGELWTAEVEGIDLAPLRLQTSSFNFLRA